MDKIVWRIAPAWGLDVDVKVIAEHSVAMNLLPKQATILDAGCRGMLFSNEMTRLGHTVFSLDCDDLKRPDYMRLALAGETGLCGCVYTQDPQGTMIMKANIPLAGCDVKMVTLKSFSKEVEIDFWDLIKMDIEGSEYEVIMSMDKPYCKQLSWEAHLHTGIYKEDKVIEMEEKLNSLGYVPAVHEKTKAHGMGLNFWDSLWILDPLFRNDPPIKINP